MTPRPVIMVVDDLWGRADDPMIESNYGSLPVTWIKETALGPSGFCAKVVLAAIASRKPALLLLDISFGAPSDRLGTEILTQIRSQYPVLPVLMFTSLDSVGNRETVIRCMELGANEYVEKAPSARRMQQLIAIYAAPGSHLALYGNSDPIRRLRADIARVAFGGDASVLITGESGTGKELVAQALHRQGPRNRGPMVVKNCASATAALLDIELFGHEKGAFPGAMDARQGLIEQADGGVLFLDEISDMVPELQGKLLRTLETRTFRRIGGTRDLQSRFQLVCATNRPLNDLLATNRLRPDFYYRIASVILDVPPLRDRPGDVRILVERFVSYFRAQGGSSYPGRRFTPETLRRLEQHTWPGNARELRNVVERALIMSREPDISLAELPLLASPEHGPANALSETPARPDLPEDPALWSVTRLRTELEYAVQARMAVERYKGASWKAEFMRLMYPEYKAANAKGFADLIKRFTGGPWGDPRWRDHPEITNLLSRLSDR